MILKKRPTVIFDPSSKEHRLYLSKFMIEHRWGECPVIFETRPMVGNLVSVLIAKVAEYYLRQEFIKEQTDAN